MMVKRFFQHGGRTGVGLACFFFLLAVFAGWSPVNAQCDPWDQGACVDLNRNYPVSKAHSDRYCLLSNPSCPTGYTCTPLSITPLLSWDNTYDPTLDPQDDIIGNHLFRKAPGDTEWHYTCTAPCWWIDTDNPPDGILDEWICPFPESGFPVDRCCDEAVPDYFCEPYEDLVWAVVAFRAVDLRSDYSNTVPICKAEMCFCNNPDNPFCTPADCCHPDGPQELCNPSL